MTQNELHLAISKNLLAASQSEDDRHHGEVPCCLLPYSTGAYDKNCHCICHSDYSTSEDASARLLDAMLSAGAAIEFQGMGVILMWRGISTVLASPDRKTAVLLAAQRWLEIEGELEDR